MKYLLNGPYFDPLAHGSNVLPGQQAYSHVMAFSSAAMAYIQLGDPRYRDALVNGWRFLDEQSYATGGWGPNELLITPGNGALASSLTTTTNHYETPCGTFATMKAARYLMRFTGDARYGDGLERIMWNGLMTVKPPDSNGNAPYYSSYHPDGRKVFYPEKWPCCSGTLVQGVADYVRNAYFHAPGALYVNLFTPSRVRGAAAAGRSRSHSTPTIQPARPPSCASRPPHRRISPSESACRAGSRPIRRSTSTAGARAWRPIRARSPKSGARGAMATG
ncbi:protein containing DUF1680, partial [mine drainage metagenome]